LRTTTRASASLDDTSPARTGNAAEVSAPAGARMASKKKCWIYSRLRIVESQSWLSLGQESYVRFQRVQARGQRFWRVLRKLGEAAFRFIRRVSVFCLILN